MPRGFENIKPALEFVCWHWPGSEHKARNGVSEQKKEKIEKHGEPPGNNPSDKPKKILQSKDVEKLLVMNLKSVKKTSEN